MKITPQKKAHTQGFTLIEMIGVLAVIAILSALLRRERSGEGDYIDVAMFDATIAFMASAVVPWLLTGRALERTGNTGYSGQPTASDGHHPGCRPIR